MTSSSLQSHFLPEGLLRQMMMVVSLLRGSKTAPSDYAPRLRDLSSSKPYQTK